MFVIPNSSAMDATASGGGPGTFVNKIATGSPEQIASLVTQRLRQAEQFLQLIERARSATQELEKAWSGNASETASKKIHDTLDAFEKITTVIKSSSSLLSTSGTLVKTAQAGYTAVVSAVNPTVAALASNWWTYGAAVSLSTAASAGLRAFIEGIEALLEVLGGSRLIQDVTLLIQIISDVERLVSSGSAGASVPPGGAFTKPGTNPVTPLVSPPSVASALGQQVAATGQDPTAASALSSAAAKAAQPTTPLSSAANGINSLTGSNSVLGAANLANAGNPTGANNLSGATGANGLTPNYPLTGQSPYVQTAYNHAQNSADSWIPVDPTPQTPVPPIAPIPPVPATPAVQPTAPAAAGHDMTITTTHDGFTTTVTMPAGQSADLTITDTVDGQSASEHIMVGASGTVSVA